MEFHTDRLLHGGDYNPDQWLEYPDILEKDIEMLKESGCNTVSLGIFAWSTLEPEEGVYRLDWMERIVDRLYENGISTILATPSGARPKWLADKYPEVLRVNRNRQKMLFGGRHNHCPSSPVYREKVTAIDRKLSERLGNHPGMILWHLSNELEGECHCPLCQEAFREWLKNRYGSIDRLNHAWATRFWSHVYNSFDQIESPSDIGEASLHGLNLDWKRFTTEQARAFVRMETAAVRSCSDRPVTTNFMYYFSGLNYFDLAQDLDVVTWDTYPVWGKKKLSMVALDNGMYHDIMRSLKGKPFFQMESCPSATNWQGVSKLKAPGVLLAQSLQAIAHGGDGALYFQIRQSRGSSEKFHGAVIDHYGGKDTRVFQEVTKTGQALASLAALAGTRTDSQAAILYDWENQWAMEDAQGPRNDGLHFKELVMHIYQAMRSHGLNVDFQDEKGDFSKYRLLAVPMAYMFRDGFDRKLRSFVESGGTLILTCWSGIVDDTDLCYLEGTPHGLMDVLGIRSAEIDALYDWEENHLHGEKGTFAEGKNYSVRYLCELPAVSDAEVVLRYGEDFYAGMPAVTVHSFGKGKAWYVGAFASEEFFEDLIGHIAAQDNLCPIVKGVLPEGLEVSERTGEQTRYVIYQNFGEQPVLLPLPEGEWTPVYGDPQKPLEVCGTVVVGQKIPLDKDNGNC